MLETKGGYLMAGTLAGWPGQVVRVRAVSRAGEPSRAQVTLGAGRPEMGGSVREDRNIINSYVACRWQQHSPDLTMHTSCRTPPSW